MKTLLLLLFTIHAAAQTAAPLDVAAARSTLSTRVRNPVKSSAPVVKRSYQRSPTKGLEVEVLERSDGTREERPYVAIPILFSRGRAELLDSVSLANVQATAALLKELCVSGASFTIQGHTSAEGERAANQVLSEQRASRILQMLLAAGLQAKHVGTAAFGPDCAMHPSDAVEELRQKDRRVLIVRN